MGNYLRSQVLREIIIKCGKNIIIEVKVAWGTRGGTPNLTEVKNVVWMYEGVSYQINNRNI